MGRGKGWTSDENELLARAWLASSEDPIAGADQKSKAFQQTILRRFKDLCAIQNKTADGQYGNRPMAACKSHFDSISHDVQKFCKALRLVRASNPTGVTEENIISMAVALHLKVTKTMCYDFKDFEKRKWINFGAWEVLKCKPKWSCTYTDGSEYEETEPVASTGQINSAQNDANVGNGSGHESEHNWPNGAEGDFNSAVLGRKRHERYRGGARNVKMLQQEAIRTQAVKSMAESAKRKSDALEEKNAIAAFSRPEAANLPETEEFFASLRKIHLAKTRKLAQAIAAAGQQSEPLPRNQTSSDDADGENEPAVFT